MSGSLPALILFLLPLAFSPGPGNMFFAAIGARFGVAATLRANVGYHIATWIVTAAIGFGFAATMEQFPKLFEIIKILGSFYVLWIAWNLYMAGAVEGKQNAKLSGIWDGAILMILNPKAYVIITLMFSQFLTGSETENFASVIAITTVFTLNNLMAFSIWAMIGDKIAELFRTPSHAGILNKLFGLILAVVALWMSLV